MKRLKPSPNEHQWPRQAVASVETRKRDLVVRIADWSRDREEPAFDVELYVGGVYDWDRSETSHLSPAAWQVPEQGAGQASRCARRASADWSTPMTRSERYGLYVKPFSGVLAFFPMIYVVYAVATAVQTWWFNNGLDLFLRRHGL